MESAVRVRRARRDDFERVRALLGAEIAADRAARKRFRRLVSTYREDLYLAEREDDQHLVGLVVVAYARGLGPPTAVVRRLLETSDDVALILLDEARTRALNRGCVRLELLLDSTQRYLAERLLGTGWQPGPQAIVRTVEGDAS